MKKHVILFLAARPENTDQTSLGRAANAIQAELERCGHRDRVAFETRWAVEPLDLLRELRKLKPTVVHVSGQRGEYPGGLMFRSPHRGSQVISTAALEDTFGAAGASVKLVVLDACYSDARADALLAHVDCVVGITGSIGEDTARSFAIGFYGGLGERESVAAAYKQGRAAIRLDGLPDGHLVQLKIRSGVDANQLIVATDRR